MGICTMVYGCGCCVSRTMGEVSTITQVSTCDEHRYIFSDTKSLRQMVSEIYQVNVIDWKDPEEEENV